MNTNEKLLIITKLSLICLICLLLLSCIFLTNAFNSSIHTAYAIDNAVLRIQVLAEEHFGENNNLVYEHLYNYNDSLDYILISNDNDYAIFLISNQELLEYSSLSNLPYEQNTKKYYGEPTKYLKKENGYFVDLLTNEQLLLSQDEIIKLSKSILDKLDCENTTTTLSNENLSILSNTLSSSHMPSNSKDLEDGDLPGTAGTTYIQNHEYFPNEPTYGNNTTGTCASVATQILLNYNNYYNDRRIIADKHLNGWDIKNNTLANSELNPNYCSDPSAINKYIMGSSGINETDNGTYFKYIKDKLPLIPLTGNIKDAIDEILTERNAILSSPINYEVDSSVLGSITNNVKSEIDNDRPVCIAISGETLNQNHYAVAYGYQSKSSSFGFITHLGWHPTYRSYSRIWINEKWCYGYVSLKINHEHTYDNYLENKNEVRCTECGHRNVPYTTEDISENELAITGTRFPLLGNIAIPYTHNGKAVTKIADSAFAKQAITGVAFPSSLNELGVGAFSECPYLNTVTFAEENQIKTISDKCFYKCSRLKTLKFPLNISAIENEAFYECESLTINLFTDQQLKYIGNHAFYGCSSAISASLPNTLETIGNGAFSQCTKLSIVEIPENSSLIEIGIAAFAASGICYINFPTGVTKIDSGAFLGCPNLTSVLIPKNVATIGFGAFSECPLLTVYCQPASALKGWDSKWIDSDRPVVWGCSISQGVHPYVTSFVKSNTNPTNMTYADVSNPYHKVTNGFEGWYTTSDFSGTKYSNIASAPNGTLYAKWKDSCIAEGSMITLADGSQKAVEDLTGDESLLVWNLFTGTYDVAPILFIDRDERGEYEVINLNFSDGTTVKVISEHAFFDVDQGKYVYLRNDAAKYIGHRFSKQSADTSGNKVNTAVTLLSVDITTETTVAYSPVTYGHLCYYVDGMLSMPGATEPFANIFEVDKATMCYDEDKMQEDIEEYGLFTYEEFSALLPVSEEVFEAFGGKYLKVAIGKGLTDLDEIAALIERYSRFLNF